MKKPHNIYIHVPFCVAKCNYCAFFSRVCRSPDWDGYADKIIDELRHFGNMLDSPAVPTVFFGGGTPSLMPTRCFGRIMDGVRKYFSLDSDAEITIEANPGTIDNTKFDDFCNMGVNRVSLGVQSFDDERLEFLGRIHNANDARKIIDYALTCRVRVSADFIYGLPNDTVMDVVRMCHEINNIGLTHCSLYELTIEPGTPFGKMNLNMPDNNAMAEMYIAIAQNLNMPRYEVSNYAVTGCECRHNQNVWDGGAYIGIGDGGAGRVFMDGTWYEQMGGGKRFCPMTNGARATERIITGMRTMRGVRIDSDTEKILNMEFAKSHPDMVRFLGDRIIATDAGILVLDDLIQNLVK